MTPRKLFLAGILAALITPGAWAAKESPSKTDLAIKAAVERSFQAVIVSADPACHTIRVRHKPTGYETDVVWNDKSTVKVTKYVDFDEVPEGWVLCGFRDVDPARKEICRLNRLEPLPASKATAKADEVKAQSGVRCKLVRVPVTPEMLKSHNRLLTQDQKRAYALDVNGEQWAVLRTWRRKMRREEAGSAADFAPGMACKELVYRQESGVNRLVSAVLEPAFVPEMQLPACPSGCTAGTLQKGMDVFRQKSREVAKQLRQRMPVRLHVVPELAGEGDPVTLEIEAWAQKSPNPEVKLDVSYLLPAAAQKRTLALAWKAGESADGLTKYTASLALPKLPVGQHCVSWTCDIGGDIPEFYRSFAVAGPGTLVAAIHICNGALPPGIAANHLPHDRWQHNTGVALTKFVAGQDVSAQTILSWTDTSKLYRQEGIEPVFGYGSYAGLPRNELPTSLVFSAEPEDVQRAVMAAVLEIGEVLGFSRERASIQSYEVGTSTVHAARTLGVGGFAAFCDYQNWADGPSGLINHSARPLQPYFASDEDFRKPAQRSKDSIVIINQINKHALLRMEYFDGAFDTCTISGTLMGRPGWGRCGRLEVDEIYLSRMLDAVEAELQLQANRKAPWFLDFGIQDFKAAKRPDETTRANVLLFDYLLRRVREGANIVFCGQRGQIDYYQRYQEIPEAVDYEPNFQCGTKADNSVKEGGMPVDYPDLMELENARYTAWFKKSEGMLPTYHWDYTKPWNYPDWGNTQLPRYAGSRTLRYDSDDRYAVTPLSTDTRKIKVSQNLSENAGGLEVTVTLETAEAIKALPLALWDIPREWKAGEGWWTVKDANRFVPIRAPYTGNLNGILEVDAQPGKNEYRLTISTPKRTPQSQDILLKTVHAKVFSRDGQTMAYLWPMQPWETQFELTVPEGKSAQYYAAPKGERVDLPPGKHRLTINQESWSRIVGLDIETLRSGIRE